LASAGELSALRSRLGSLPVGPAVWAWSALACIAIAWPVFVFDGSQLAYLLTAIAASGLAVGWARRRSRLLVLLVVGEVVLIGSEAGGHLGHGSAPLGSLRLLDVTLLVALVTLGANVLAAEAEKGPLAERMRLRASEIDRRELIRRAPGAAILAAAVLWAGLLWLAHGHRVDSILHPDVRVLGLGIATWIVVATCRQPPPRDLAWALPLFAVPAAVKAFAIWASTLYVIGANDRLQATLVGTTAEGRRVILIGGDTFLILVPAIALLALGHVRDTVTRAVLVFSALAALGGLLVSATRTGLLMAIGLVVCVLGANLIGRRRIGTTRGNVAVAAVFLAVVGIAAWRSGFVDRLNVENDAPHAGINFRTDEVRTFLHLPAKDILLGQGFGGRFTTRSAINEPTISGWSHVLPVWIGLKVGLLGLAATCFALLLLTRRALRLLRLGGPPAREAALGVVITVGMLLMSLTIDRAAIPEGVPLLALGLALIPEHPR
jgi:hypothetical protein